jgi:hypothetical protein
MQQPPASAGMPKGEDDERGKINTIRHKMQIRTYIAVYTPVVRFEIGRGKGERAGAAINKIRNKNGAAIRKMKKEAPLRK